MKYWKLFFLCLTLNSCIKEDTVQDSAPKKELQSMQKSLFQNYACLETLIKIATEIKYNIDDDVKHINHLNFWCNCSKENLQNNQESIKQLLNKKISDSGCIENIRNSAIKRKYTNDIDFNKSILQMYSDKTIEDDIGVILSDVIKNYIKKSKEFFHGLKEELSGDNNKDPQKGYVKSVSSGKLKNSVIAFDKLFGYLEELCNRYNEQIQNLDNEQIISCFFSNFLIQFYNIYYENIYRNKEDDKGILKEDLSFLSSIK